MAMMPSTSVRVRDVKAPWIAVVCRFACMICLRSQDNGGANTRGYANTSRGTALGAPPISHIEPHPTAAASATGIHPKSCDKSCGIENGSVHCSFQIILIQMFRHPVTTGYMI